MLTKQQLAAEVFRACGDYAESINNKKSPQKCKALITTILSEALDQAHAAGRAEGRSEGRTEALEEAAHLMEHIWNPLLGDPSEDLFRVLADHVRALKEKK